MDRTQIKSTSVDKFVIAALPLAVLLIVTAVISPEGAAGLLVVLAGGGLFLLVFRVYTADKTFITRLFMSAVAIRLAVGVAIHMLGLREFFGGDANTYDSLGTVLLNTWLGVANNSSWDVIRVTSLHSSGWGMYYVVATIYLFAGRNIFAAQCFCAVIGAAIAPMVYYCADAIFGNRRVSRISAIVAAFFPAMIIWSSQLLKDGLLVFLIVLAMTMVIQLQRRVNAVGMILLGFSLFGILSLRFYIFYMVALAVAGSFVVGASKSNRSIVGRVIVLAVLGVSLTYFGVIRTASTDLERFGSLAQVQNSRGDPQGQRRRDSTPEADVSTPEGHPDAPDRTHLFDACCSHGRRRT